MSSVRFATVIAGVCIVAVIALGCRQRESARNSSTKPQSAAATTLEQSSQGAKENIPDTDDVSRRAESFAREMESARIAKAPTTSSSNVQWQPQSHAAPVTDAAPEVILRDAETESLASPEKLKASPVVSVQANQAAESSTRTSSSAPQVAALTRAAEAMVDEPTIVPEGDEVGIGRFAATRPVRVSESGDLETRLAGRVHENPLEVPAHLDYQLHQFIMGRSVPELSSLASLPNEDREVVAAVMDGLSNFRSTMQADPNALLSRRVKPLIGIAERLRGHSGLTIPSAKLCRRVDAFGVYEAIQPPKFTPGAWMLVYTEVRNFNSQLDAKQAWETRLTHTLMLYDEAGRRIGEDSSAPVIDTCQSRRSDFFIVRRYQIPSSAASGRYILKIRVRDDQTNHVTEMPISLEVAS